MAKRGQEFTQVQMTKPGGNVFNLTHDVKLSMKMGLLVPTLVMDCIPGDKVRIEQENMMRFTPLLAPIMHRIYADTHYFFVPNRLLWENWEKFITNTPVAFETQAVPPYLVSLGTQNLQVGSLLDYMGVPPMTYTQADSLQINALPFKAYELIWHEYYRDQNMQEQEFQKLVDGPNAVIYSTTPFQRAWMHDYFTSALPWAQKGDAVMLPLTDTPEVPVRISSDWQDQPQYPFYMDYDGFAPTGTKTLQASSYSSKANILADGHTGAPEGNSLVYNPAGTLSIDVQSDAVTINTLRRAFKLQEWLEKNARGGTRYVEHILSHFGVRSSDKRLGRPEYLGGLSQNIVISEVLSTAETLDAEDTLVNPVGQMAGHGISTQGGKAANYYVEEHGFIIGITSVLPRTAYQDGLSRMWTRPTALDYYWPSFAHIGEQEVLNKELYAISATPNEVFGYIPRYSEYKYISDRVAGEMRTTLNYWHMGRIFEEQPTLNSNFISSTPTTRIFAVEEGDHIIAHIINKVNAYRLVPRFSDPTF